MRAKAKALGFNMRTIRTEDSKTYISKSGETWVYKIELKFATNFQKIQKELPL